MCDTGRARPWLTPVGAALMSGLAGCGEDGPVKGAEGDPGTIVEEADEQDFAGLIAGDPFEGTAVVTEVVSPRPSSCSVADEVTATDAPRAHD